MTTYDAHDLSRPKRTKPARAEWHMQAECVTFIRKMQRYNAWYRDNVRFIAAQSEGRRDAKRASIAKMMGLQPGVADLLILIKRPGIDRLTWIWCELKKPGGKMSPAQAEWFRWLHDTPVQRHVFYDVQDFITMMEAQR